MSGPASLRARVPAAAGSSGGAVEEEAEGVDRERGRGRGSVELAAFEFLAGRVVEDALDVVAGNARKEAVRRGRRQVGEGVSHRVAFRAQGRGRALRRDRLSGSEWHGVEAAGEGKRVQEHRPLAMGPCFRKAGERPVHTGEEYRLRGLVEEEGTRPDDFEADVVHGILQRGPRLEVELAPVKAGEEIG